VLIRIAAFSLKVVDIKMKYRFVKGVNVSRGVVPRYSFC
jgi:hypothetical protein